MEEAHALCLWVLKGLSVGSCGNCSILLENSCIGFFPLCKHTRHSAPRPLLISALCLDSLLLRPSPPQRVLPQSPLAPWPGAPTVFLTTPYLSRILFIYSCPLAQCLSPAWDSKLPRAVTLSGWVRCPPCLTHSRALNAFLKE